MKFRVMVTCCPDWEDCAACAGWPVAAGLAAAALVAATVGAPAAGVVPADGAGAEQAASKADRPNTSESAPRVARVVETFTSAPLAHRFLARLPTPLYPLKIDCTDVCDRRSDARQATARRLPRPLPAHGISAGAT